MSLVLAIPAIGLILAANVAQRDRASGWAVFAMLAAVSGCGAVAALLVAAWSAIGAELDLLEASASGSGSLVVGAVLVVALVAILPAARTALARLIPIDPDSIVHAVALYLTLVLAGVSLASLVVVGDPETAFIEQAAQLLTPFELWSQAAAFVAGSVFGVGLMVRRTWPEARQRLGLAKPGGRDLALGAIALVVCVVGSHALELAWQAADPAGVEQLRLQNRQLFGHLMTAPGILTIALSAGIGEEMLFRGALQPRLGLVLTSATFAIVHVQYGASLALVELLFVGLVLGVLRVRANTTTAILVHSAFNLLVAVTAV
jgi:hypothetical protein